MLSTRNGVMLGSGRNVSRRSAPSPLAWATPSGVWPWMKVFRHSSDRPADWAQLLRVLDGDRRHVCGLSVVGNRDETRVVEVLHRLDHGDRHSAGASGTDK